MPVKRVVGVGIFDGQIRNKEKEGACRHKVLAVRRFILIKSQVVPGNGMRARRQPRSEIVVLTPLLPSDRRRRRCFSSVVTLTTSVIVGIAIPEDRAGRWRSRFSKRLLVMARQSVADGQITMVQSQKVRQTLARPIGFAGIHKLGAILGQFLIVSQLMRCKLMVNNYVAGLPISDFEPTLESKWLHGKLKRFLQMVLQPNFGGCHELGVKFLSLFLSRASPEICLAKIIARHVLHEGIIHILQVGDSNWAFFFRSWTSPAAYENLKKKYEMPKELISYQYPTK